MYSLRVKTSIFYSLILLAILIIYNAILLFSIRHFLYRDVDTILRLKAEELVVALNAYAHQENGGILSGNVSNVSAKVLSFEKTFRKSISQDDRDSLWFAEAKELKLADDYIFFLNDRYKGIKASPNLSPALQKLFMHAASRMGTTVAFHTVQSGDTRIRIIHVPFLYEGHAPYFLQVGTSLSSVVKKQTKIIKLMMFGSVIVLFITSFWGSIFVVRILKPVTAVANTAKTISHKGLHMRITSSTTDKEMKFLVDSFNMMISRLESAFKHINEFSSNVAHELKTPLAVMRGELELVEDGVRPAEEYKKAIAVSLQEVRQMIRIIEDLLLLARLEYKTDAFTFERSDFTRFLEAQIYEPTQILATEKKIHVQINACEHPLMVNIDTMQLRRLFFNLITNAIRYTADHGSITITTVRKGNVVRCAIQDTGRGIAPEHLSKIFDRFYRVPLEKAVSAEGSGLGLSIALSIAKAHGGDITVQSILGTGSVFTVILPLD